MMLLNVPIVYCAIAVCLIIVGLLVVVDRIRHPAVRGRHEAPAPPADPPRAAPGYTFGAMFLDDERDWQARVRPDGIVYTNDAGEVHLKPWEQPHSAEAGAIWAKRATWNGHTFGCLRPDEDHRGACPEEGDDPDDPYDWPVPGLPDMLPAGPVDEDPGLVDAALALAADDPGDAGWTDQLLADLHDAPTVLDGIGGDHAVAPTNERLADTGEMELAWQRAGYAAELRAQYDDTAEYILRLKSDAAQFRLSFNGL